jgi:hypothetical protein
MRTRYGDDGIDGSVWGQKSFGKESLREPINDIGNETGAVIQNNLNSQCKRPRYLMALAGASNTKRYFMFMLLVGIAMSELKMSH